MKVERDQQVHALRLQNASLRLDKQNLRTKMDEMNGAIDDLQGMLEQNEFQKTKLSNELGRVQEIALSQ